MKIHLVPVLAFAAAAGGCATSPAPEKSATVTADETELVMPAGSHIRTRVKKGQQAEGASPVATATGDQLSDAINSRNGSVPSTPVPKSSP